MKRDPGAAMTAQARQAPAALGRKLRAATRAALSEDPTPEALAEAGRAALETAEAAFAELREGDASVRRELARLDCRKYCAHCCYKTVSVSPAEVFHLARYLKANLSSKALVKLKARLRALEDKTRGMSPQERGRAQLPCALLVGRLCIAHPARPASCRGFNSADVGACERALKQRDVEIPVYALQYRLFGEAHLGLRAGLAERGLASTHLELTRALRIALEEPDAAARYLAGEPVFRAAELE
ncbi:MAG: YkgJ family cysteine cluster protein [Kiloniellales bacterium]